MGEVSASNQWRAGGPMNGNRVPVIGEESSTNGDANSQLRNTRNVVRTNKQYVEDPRAMARGRPPPGGQGARSPVVATTQARGAPKVSKNNYFGGGNG